MMRVEVNPALLRWARERARLPLNKLANRFPKLPEWEAGKAQPTLKQLESFADATAAPLGYLFLAQPPDEPLPIPDFRTLRDGPLRRPSANLLDTIYDLQRRQAWLREERIEAGHDRLAFVGSATRQAAPAKVAGAIRERLGIVADWAEFVGTWSDALRWLRECSEAAGITVVINGVVGNNTHRKLDPDEFRGFVLPDDYAPFIFVNGADSKAAQMFTVAHELAHLWIGQPAIFDLEGLQPAPDPGERFCNAVAAEFLVPQAELRKAWRDVAGNQQRFAALARRFKVSEIVAARRALDAGLIGRDDFFDFYDAYRKREKRRADEREGGGNFYATQNYRVGRHFAQAVGRAVKEGRLLYGDAYRLTGLSGATFDNYIAAAIEPAARR